MILKSKVKRSLSSDYFHIIINSRLLKLLMVLLQKNLTLRKKKLAFKKMSGKRSIIL